MPDDSPGVVVELPESSDGVSESRDDARASSNDAPATSDDSGESVGASRAPRDISRATAALLGMTLHHHACSTFPPPATLIPSGESTGELCEPSGPYAHRTIEKTVWRGR